MALRRIQSGNEERAQSTPANVRIAVEAKAVMTEHRKAIKSRKRDLEAHLAHVHDYDPYAIAGRIAAINVSPTFKSPLRMDVTDHRNVMALISHCIHEVNSITMSGGSHAAGLDAKCARVVVMDNVDYPTMAYLDGDPTPVSGGLFIGMRSFKESATCISRVSGWLLRRAFPSIDADGVVPCRPAVGGA